jgi:hypothetical protein
VTDYCEHPDGDGHEYVLGADPVAVRFCRRDGCGTWLIFVNDPSKGNYVKGGGLGLEAYQDAIAEIAREFPAWDGAAFLYDLAGHAVEMSR